MNISDFDDSKEIIAHLTSAGFYSEQMISDSLQNFLFYEFDLRELGLPSHTELLESTMAVKDQIGLQPWTTKFGKSRKYSGFSLTYNPDYKDTSSSKFHQTWGSGNLLQNYGRSAGMGEHDKIRNTYYDTFAFRKIDPIIGRSFGSLFSKLSMPIFRSRVAFLNMFGKSRNDSDPHVDEPPTHLLRINIPLQTSREYIIEIDGRDEYGNELSIRKHLELGKAYIWNTRIPHKVTVNRRCEFPEDRIHIVLGLGTWIDYDPYADCYTKSKLHGIPLKEIVEKKLFLKN